MEFGIFDSFDPGRGDDSGKLLGERLILVAEADKFRFHRYHVTEHAGMSPHEAPHSLRAFTDKVAPAVTRAEP